jgi:hypothetical protein
MIIGTVVIVLFSVLALRGTKLLLCVTNGLFLVSMIGVVVARVILGTSTNTTFQGAFAKFASYQGIIDAAHAAGYSPVAQNPSYATLGLTIFMWASLGYGIVAAYFGGELKSVKKNMFVSSIVAVIFGGMIIGAYW